jgi:hypothetical protein
VGRAGHARYRRRRLLFGSRRKLKILKRERPEPESRPGFSCARASAPQTEHLPTSG